MDGEFRIHSSQIRTFILQITFELEQRFGEQLEYASASVHVRDQPVAASAGVLPQQIDNAIAIPSRCLFQFLFRDANNLTKINPSERCQRSPQLRIRCDEHVLNAGRRVVQTLSPWYIISGTQSVSGLEDISGQGLEKIRWPCWWFLDSWWCSLSRSRGWFNQTERQLESHAGAQLSVRHDFVLMHSTIAVEITQPEADVVPVRRNV